MIARETAVLVARDRLSTPRAAAAASESLAEDSVLTGVQVSVETTAALVVVTITGNAPGILRGTSSPVRVTAAVSLEGWVPL